MRRKGSVLAHLLGGTVRERAVNGGPSQKQTRWLLEVPHLPLIDYFIKLECLHFRHLFQIQVVLNCA